MVAGPIGIECGKKMLARGGKEGREEELLMEGRERMKRDQEEAAARGKSKRRGKGRKRKGKL